MKKLTTNQTRVEELKKKVERINDVSPSFCLAKWLQSTVYLHTGMTHSCHHPSPHKIPLSEVKQNPSALHNTHFKSKIRKEMLKGSRPKECQYCWNIEDLDEGHFSDRHYKSGDQWAFPHLEKVLKSGTDPIAPTYLEVAFDSHCNFKCAYCSPDISSKWMEEIKKFGPYPTSNKTGNIEWLKSEDRFPYSHLDDNPYVDAFWKWWPQIYQNLNTFRITGGEPLLSKNTWKVFDSILDEPQKNLNLAINSNFGVPNEIFDKFINKYDEVVNQVKSFEVFTSCEAYGKQAEYVRFGLNYSKFIDNIEKFLSNTQSSSRVNLMITFNALSAPSFGLFLEDVWKLREKYNETDSMNRIPIMINYLRWPQFMAMNILPKDLKTKWANQYIEIINKYSRNQRPNKPGRFYLEEIDQVNRLCEHMLKEPDNVHDLRTDFSLFFNEYDKRRNTSFEETFPELAKFYQDHLPA